MSAFAARSQGLYHVQASLLCGSFNVTNVLESCIVEFLAQWLFTQDA